MHNNLHLKTRGELVENAVLFVLELEWNSHFVGSKELGIWGEGGFWSGNFGSKEGNGMDRGKNSHGLENFVPSRRIAVAVGILKRVLGRVFKLKKRI